MTGVATRTKPCKEKTASAVAVAVAMAAAAAAGTEATEKPKADARKRKASTKSLMEVLYKRNVLLRKTQKKQEKRKL